MIVGAGTRGRTAGPCRWRASEGLLDLWKDDGRCIRKYHIREGRDLPLGAHGEHHARQRRGHRVVDRPETRWRRE